MRRNAHWCRPKTYRSVWVWFTLLPQLQSKLHSRWAPNSGAPESRTTLYRHTLPVACCTASSKQYLRYSSGPAEAAAKPGWREDSERAAGREISPLACWANAVGKRAGRAVRLTSNEIHSPTSRNLNNRRGKEGGAQGFSIGNLVLRIDSAGAEHTVDKRCN